VLAPVLFLIWILVIFAGYVYVRHWLMRSQARQRILDGFGEAGPAAGADDEDRNFLARWLSLAGYRSPNAVVSFVSAEVLCLCVGIVVACALVGSGMVETSSRLFHAIPGAVSDLFSLFVHTSPWLFAAALTMLPWLVVRDARKRRVNQVEQDLPVVLELLATLSEAGLGFDAALDRVLGAQPPQRPLTMEFRTFQLEVLAGRARVQCLRRLTRRVQVTSLSILVSALIQTEQVGSAVADTLRRQAEDMRNRRRERALAAAGALPVKLMFPLVACFLPGILALTMGPIFYEFLQMADRILRTPGSPAGP
jgi:tight adherence protein C